MKVEEVVKKLTAEKEKKVPSRFPCRAIMVDTPDQYRYLLGELKKIPNTEMVTSDELFSSQDVMPRYDILTDAKYRNKWLILPGVSEYLRLFHKSEEQAQRFLKLWKYQAASDSLGRILVPLWGCEAQWHDKALYLCDDVRQDDFYYDCTLEKEFEYHLDVVVLSGKLKEYAGKMTTAGGSFFDGLKDWYDYWAAPEKTTHHTLLTNRISNVQETHGDVSISVIKDAFAVICERMEDGNKLTPENCPQEAAALLFFYALEGRSVRSAICSALNVRHFRDEDVMSKWAALSVGEKQLIKLWAALYPDDSYLIHCVTAAKTLDEITQHILMDIFPVKDTHPKWVEEHRVLMAVMKLPKTQAFFAQLDEIPVYADRLNFLSADTKEERIYLLNMVGKWLREDPAQVEANETIAKVYPELHAYLSEQGYHEDQARYFSLYKSYKLENKLPEDEEIYFAGIRPEDYSHRYYYLSQYMNDSTIVLWIDALGAEWMPLLLWSLGKVAEGKIVESKIGRALLPTETCYNDQWNQMNVPHKKLDKLDKLAHKGVIDEPDYYACVEDQFSAVIQIADVVRGLFDQYRRVIITGDHGTSRLAARFFHKREGLIVPNGAQVCSHGRYCKSEKPIDGSVDRSTFEKDGVCYSVFRNYDHFKMSGFAAGGDDDNAVYGEIHGGATPEELLVPIVVIDSKKEIPLTAKWTKNSIKVRMKKAAAEIKFSKPVGTLQVKIDVHEAVCSAADDKKKWKVVFSGVEGDNLKVAVVADGKLVDIDPLTIESALGEDDFDF